MTTAKKSPVVPNEQLPAPLNIHQRMLAVMGDVERVEKEDKLVNQQYRYVSHDTVTKALHGPCAKHGILVSTSVHKWEQDGNRTSATIEVMFINVDNPLDFISVIGFGFGIDKQDKGPGKAVSYALKTVLLKQFLLEAGEPDNEASLEEHKGGNRASAGGSTPRTAPSTSSGASSYGVIDKDLFSILERFSQWHGTLLEGDHYPNEWVRGFISDFVKKFNQYGDKTKMNDNQAEKLRSIWSDLEKSIKEGTIEEISGMLGD